MSEHGTRILWAGDSEGLTPWSDVAEPIDQVATAMAAGHDAVAYGWPKLTDRDTGVAAFVNPAQVRALIPAPDPSEKVW